MTLDNWILAVVAGHVFGFWILVFLVFRLRRQVRCLHFCYVGISDWGIERLSQERDDYIRTHGQQFTPFTLLHVERDWKVKADYYGLMQIRAGVRVPKDNHINFVMEDLH